MNDRITLKDIELLLHIGINNDERAMAQKVLVDITIKTPLHDAGAADDLALTVDYRPLLEYIKRTIVPRKWNTIEALAHHVCEATRYIAHEQHPRRKYIIRVSVRKPEAHLPLVAKYPSVCITRRYDALVAPLHLIAEAKWDEIRVAASTLYKQESLGYAYVPQVISEEDCGWLLTELSKGTFEVSPLVYGNATQRLSSFTLGAPDPLQPEKAELSHKFVGIQSLWQAMGALYQTVCEENEGDTDVPLNAVCAHRYHISEGGLTAHMDESRFRNIIMVLVLKGEADFIVGNSVEEVRAYERHIMSGETIRPQAGSLILIRAPRSDEDGYPRPYHAVGAVTNERVTIMFRADRKYAQIQ